MPIRRNVELTYKINILRKILLYYESWHLIYRSFEMSILLNNWNILVEKDIMLTLSLKGIFKFSENNKIQRERAPMQSLVIRRMRKAETNGTVTAVI